MVFDSPINVWGLVIILPFKTLIASAESVTESFFGKSGSCGLERRITGGLLRTTTGAVGFLKMLSHTIPYWEMSRDAAAFSLSARLLTASIIAVTTSPITATLRIIVTIFNGQTLGIGTGSIIGGAGVLISAISTFAGGI